MLLHVQVLARSRRSPDSELMIHHTSRTPGLFMRKLLALLFLAIATAALADFTIMLDAGRLRLSAAAVMPLDSVLVFVAAGGDGLFSNSLAPGQYASGNDIVLSVITVPGSAGGFNNSGGLDETLNALTISTANFPTLAVGDLLALRWFPQISLAQFNAGTTPAAGNNFGTYNPLFWGNGSNNPDGGNEWAVPGGGATINLSFFTTDSGGGGTQDPTEGYGQFVVGGVPTITLTVSDSSASEVPSTDIGKVRITRTGPTTSVLTVFYTISGTAKNGRDYKKLHGQAIIKIGAVAANVAIQPIDDTIPEPDEPVILTLLPNAAYAIGSPNTGTVTIHRNE